MKTFLLLAAGLILVGCNQQSPSNREVLTQLETLKSEIARREPSVRWAFANKREIDTAVFQWSRDKMEVASKAEALAPETEQKIKEYEALKAQLFHKEMESRGMKLPRAIGASVPNENYETLSNRVAEAKVPLAEIVERRSLQATQYRAQFSTEKLIADYVNGRFDLVVDSSDERMSRSAVLYRTNGEVPDITDGVIKLLQEKAVQ